jgi:hypothetical protein
LVAYTVSLYRAAQGSRKDQPTVPLNISFAVVLHDEPLEFKGSDGGEEAQLEDGEATEEDGDEAVDNQSKVEVDLSDVPAEEQSNNELPVSSLTPIGSFLDFINSDINVLSI